VSRSSRNSQLSLHITGTVPKHPAWLQCIAETPRAIPDTGQPVGRCETQTHHLAPMIESYLHTKRREPHTVAELGNDIRERSSHRSVF